MTEPTLFDWAPAQRHSPTSIEAAARIEPHMNAMHIRILAYLRDCVAGATDDEIQVALDMNPSTERPRRIELAARGKIKASGETRKTRSGRNAVVWVIA